MMFITRVLSASLWTLAVASAGVFAYAEAWRSTALPLAQCDDAVSLLRSSHEFILEAGSERDPITRRPSAFPTPAPTAAPTSAPTIAKYVLIKDGTCEENYKCEIKDVDMCEEAAQELELDLRDPRAYQKIDSNRDVSGCIYKHNAWKLLYWNNMSRGIGANATWPFWVLCVNKPEPPTPPPTVFECHCVDDWSAGYGSCDTYADGAVDPRTGKPYGNFEWCEHDEDKRALPWRGAWEVCSECKDCVPPARGCPTPTPKPTERGNDITPEPTFNCLFCPPPSEDDYVCTVSNETKGNRCIATCGGDAIECEGACPCPPTATGDPHVSNLAGEHFDINQPADHQLLRVPLDPSKQALLELRGLVKADDVDDECAMYIRMVTLRGEWLGNSTVQVRPLQRDQLGANDAGDATKWNFSIRSSTASTDGAWKSVDDFGAGGTGAEPLSPFVSVAARRGVEEFGSGKLTQAFEFVVGRDAASRASIVVFQAQRQALNLQLLNLKAFGDQRLGGLLGTETHSSEVEEKTDECKTRQSGHRSDDLEELRRLPPSNDALRLSASW